MCITFFHTNPDPKDGQFLLVIVMNRDEAFNRSTEPADWKNSGGNLPVLAGLY